MFFFCRKLGAGDEFWASGAVFQVSTEVPDTIFNHSCFSLSQSKMLRIRNEGYQPGLWPQAELPAPSKVATPWDSRGLLSRVVLSKCCEDPHLGFAGLKFSPKWAGGDPTHQIP